MPAYGKEKEYRLLHQISDLTAHLGENEEKIREEKGIKKLRRDLTPRCYSNLFI